MNDELLQELEDYYSNYLAEDTEITMTNFDNVEEITYGQTPLSTFKKLIGLTTTPKRFICLGSSIGWQCFFWNSLFPNIPAIGYEIHELRCGFANYLKDKYEINNVEFRLQDLIEADIQDGDLIWQNNTLIDLKITNVFNFQQLTQLNDLQVISYVPILLKYLNDENELRLLHKDGNIRTFKQRTIELPVSWSDKFKFWII